ncbi:MAG: hypothetical protein U0872_16380, partial [Planctomycetaceae bacterium]
KPVGAAVAGARQTVGAAGKIATSPAAVAGRSMNWLDAVSQLQLKAEPVVTKSPAVRRILDAPEDSVTSYKLPRAREEHVVGERISKKASEFAEATARTNRQFFNTFSRLFRKINDATYGISLIFLIVAIVGVILQKHSVVVFGISLIVLLSLVGLAAGIANLITINFRRNPMRGLLFLIPPVTVYYLWQDAEKWRKPLGRIVTPAAILIGVIAAYMYIPWLNGSETKHLDLQKALNAVKQDVKGSVSKSRQELEKLKNQIPEDLQKQATDAVKDATGQLRTGEKAESGSPKDRPTSPPQTPGP